MGRWVQVLVVLGIVGGAYWFWPLLKPGSTLEQTPASDSDSESESESESDSETVTDGETEEPSSSKDAQPNQTQSQKEPTRDLLAEAIAKLEKGDASFDYHRERPEEDEKIPATWISGPKKIEFGRYLTLELPAGYVYVTGAGIRELEKNIGLTGISFCYGDCLVITREFKKRWVAIAMFIKDPHRTHQLIPLDKVPQTYRDMGVNLKRSSTRAWRHHQYGYWKELTKMVGQVKEFKWVQPPIWDAGEFRLSWMVQGGPVQGLKPALFQLYAMGVHGDVTVQIIAEDMGEALLESARFLSTLKFVDGFDYTNLPVVEVDPPKYVPREGQFDALPYWLTRGIIWKAWTSAVRN